ncbi:TetR/AcrR family transcriptional regulator [Chelatococcus reniformis]|uniref:TetR family transcriptional regulator n=1 Tax=Chelatococcus reniformis TaxID=1494448 RepID=A0A916UJW3_9HYPH|nr:TetR/AcrR family transcriptional regulator [Chelatococcus reniformis]GGC75629.1 TetR family transcriptional regulator [Chelatococcus reniformis]
MARPKEFDRDEVLEAAIRVFREHGYEGSSAEMLVRAMGIGRQSLYDTFGDKWQLYCAAVQRYVACEIEAHVTALRGAPRALDGIRAMIERVVAEAPQACLGVNSICEFGRSRPELSEIQDASARALHIAIAKRVREAQADGEVAAVLDTEAAAGFVAASFATIRIAARGGADARELHSLGHMAMRALR